MRADKVPELTAQLALETDLLENAIMRTVDQWLTETDSSYLVTD